VFLTRVLEPFACEGFVICYAREARKDRRRLTTIC
jgi:hypothetical protein